jgi:tetratricopeptide (TPR) repeat protein
MRRRRTGLAALVALLWAGVAGAAAPRAVELPAPPLVVTVTPVPLGVERAPLEPPPPPPVARPPADLGRAPAPRFISAVTKPFPAVADPGGFACVFVALGRAETLANCGVHRLATGDHQRAREAFEESVAIDERGAQAPAAFAWLGELAMQEGTPSAAVRAERWYRAALLLAPPRDLAVHAEVGLGLLALRRDDAREAEAALERALRGVPAQPVALVARYLLGVARLLLGRPDAAIALFDEVEHSGAPGAMVSELPFWRAVALARLGDARRAEDQLLRFVDSVPAGHPLRGDALVQAGWIGLEHGAPEEAVRRFLRAEGTGPRPDLRPQIRAGQVQAYLALKDTVRARGAARQLKVEAPRDPLAAAALLLIADADSAAGAGVEAADVYREILLLPLAAPLQDYVRYRLGEALERAGRPAEARDHYRELRDRGRDEGVAQRASYRLGLLALRENDVGAARRDAEALLRVGVLAELREGVLALIGESALRGGDPNRAVAVLRAVLREYAGSPHAPRARLALGWALAKDGDSESALREWREVAGGGADAETRALAWVAIADTLLRQGREPEAAEALRQLGAAPAGVARPEALRLNRGILAVRTRAYGEALQVLEAPPPPGGDLATQALVARALGVAYYELGRYEQAERQFRLAARVAPQEPSSWLGAGLAALAQHRLAEAEDALGRARYAAVDVATAAWYGLVLTALQRGDRELFRERATNFVDRFPRHAASPAVLYALAASALERADVAEAQAWTQRLLREHAASEYGTDALLRLAATAGSRPDVARQAYRDLLQRPVTPADVRADAWLGLAETALAARDPAEAQRAAEGFLGDAAADPRAPRAYAILARAQEEHGQKDRALQTVDAFLARFPQDPAAPAFQLSRGQLLLDGRRPDEAARALEAAREAPDAAVAAAAQFWLGEALRTRGDLEAATSAYLAATYVYPESPWAARGLQGAALAYVARQMPREAGIVLRKLAARPGTDPALVQWARDSLARLGAAATDAPPRAPAAATPPRRS